MADQDCRRTKTGDQADDVKLAGWAIECRIIAEDAGRFSPNLNNRKFIPKVEHPDRQWRDQLLGNHALFWFYGTTDRSHETRDRHCTLAALKEILDKNQTPFHSASVMNKKFKKGDFNASLLKRIWKSSYNDEEDEMLAAYVGMILLRI
jgi:acetyl/propionyl-CoA carboxylase alpha subunit